MKTTEIKTKCRLRVFVTVNSLGLKFYYASVQIKDAGEMPDSIVYKKYDTLLALLTDMLLFDFQYMQTNMSDKIDGNASIPIDEKITETYNLIRLEGTSGFSNTGVLSSIIKPMVQKSEILPLGVLVSAYLTSVMQSGSNSAQTVG